MARTLRVTVGSREFTAAVDAGVVTIDGVDGAWTVTRDTDGRMTVVHQGSAVRVHTARTPAAVWVGSEGLSIDAQVDSGRARPKSAASGADALRPPMPATVVRINVAPGATIAEGDVLLVLEAMKMELPIRAPRAGVVKAVHYREGELVQPASVLIDLE